MYHYTIVSFEILFVSMEKEIARPAISPLDIPNDTEIEKLVDKHIRIDAHLRLIQDTEEIFKSSILIPIYCLSKKCDHLPTMPNAELVRNLRH